MMKNINSILKIACSALAVAIANSNTLAQESVNFEPTVESLQQYECPEWFRDAKFGIWSCWNAYTVPGQGDWYARRMYTEGHKVYKYHCKTYGHPSEFGYKDVVDLWKGENFNPKEQIKLFKEAGAKYFVAMANHHDNFDLWNSKYSEWNSVNYGPKRDVIGEWYEAVQGSGLRWGVSSHVERAASWLQVSKLADTKGKYKGVPYDGADPKNDNVYLKTDPNLDTSPYQPVNASGWWRELWLNRTKDLIDNYKPDIYYIDGGVPFPGDDKGATGLEMISHLYNKNTSFHNGSNEAVMCIKNWYHIEPDGAWGYYWDGIATLDFEKKRSVNIIPKPWQTDTNLGEWTWTPACNYRSAESVIVELVDIVSKNGNMLLNVSPRPDGTLDADVTKLLKEIGRWLKINGESIYETRPWKIAGNGDLRVVKKGDDIYVTSLVQPKGKTLVVPFLADGAKGTKIRSVKMLDGGKSLTFTESSNGLIINLPNKLDGEYAWVFKIEGDDLWNYDIEKYIDRGDLRGDMEKWYSTTKQDVISKEWGAVAYDTDGTKWGISKYGDLVEDLDYERKILPYKVQDIDFTDSGYSAFVTIAGELYFGKDKRWNKVSNFDKVKRISIDELGTWWCVREDGSVWSKNLTDKVPHRSKFPLSIDVACGSNGQLALVDKERNDMRYIENGELVWWIHGSNMSRVEFSPKSSYVIAIQKGRVAVYRDKVWHQTGIRAKEITSATVNGVETIGCVKEGEGARIIF